MKIWILQTETPTHKIVRFNCEEHSDLIYLDEFTDDAFKEYLQTLQADIDADKNLKLIKYYGYLHLLLKK